MQKILLITILLISTSSAYSYVDLNLSYSYTKRRVEGVDASGKSDPDFGEALSTTSGYYINWAWYMWEYTALELNYSESDEKLKDDRQVVDSSSGLTIKEVNSLIKTTVQGIGIRQSFANRKAAFIPSLAIGYARLTTSGNTKYIVNESGTDYTLTYTRDKEVFNSSYVTLSLAIRITQLIRLTLTGKAVMPDMDTTQAENNLTYSAGFSWMF